MTKDEVVKRVCKQAGVKVKVLKVVKGTLADWKGLPTDKEGTK